MNERLAAIRQLASETRRIAGAVAREVGRDLTAPINYVISLRGEKRAVYLGLVGAAWLTDGVIGGLSIGFEAGAIGMASTYIANGVLLNHPEWFSNTRDYFRASPPNPTVSLI